MATKPLDYSWTEPESDWNAVPPLNNVTQTESGHSFEMDDTPGAERIRLQHRAGTFTEIQANGQQIVKVLGDKYEIIASNNNVLISGVCNITVEGDSVFHVKGDSYNQVDGDSYLKVKGKTNLHSTDSVEVFSGGDINLNALATGGTINMRATDGVNIQSDLNVSGSINARKSVTAVQNISAGMRLGSIAGVETTGPIYSAVSVFAPMVTDIGGSMMGMRLVYDFHTHPTPRGPTGIPFNLM